MLEESTKVCTKCHEQKPFSAFCPNKRGKFGLRADCRECQAVYGRGYRESNEAKIATRKAAHYAANQESERAKVTAWREANPEKMRAAVQAWRGANTAKGNASSRAWRQAHPEKIRVHRQTRRARLRGVETESVLVSVLFERDRGVCGICKKLVNPKARDKYLRPSHDHIVPLAEGGANTYTNAQLAHLRCNIRRRHLGPAQVRLGI